MNMSDDEKDKIHNIFKDSDTSGDDNEIKKEKEIKDKTTLKNYINVVGIIIGVVFAVFAVLGIRLLIAAKYFMDCCGECSKLE